MTAAEPMSEWMPAAVDPARAGWYECRYFDGDIPQRYWFDGSLWRHTPKGQCTQFGNDADNADAESWRGLTVPAVAIARQ